MSSAPAAPALPGIPLTHRGFAVVSGHGPAGREPAVDGLSPNALTLVVRSWARLARAAGASPARARRPLETPAAALLAASTEDAFTWVGTLRELGGAALPEGVPGTLVVGGVAALAPVIGPARAAIAHRRNDAHAEV